MVETEHSTESLKALDWTDGRFVVAIRLDQSVVEPLMIPLGMVMSRELASGLPKRPFSEEDHSVETLMPERPHEPLGVGVEAGRSMRQADDRDAGVG